MQQNELKLTGFATRDSRPVSHIVKRHLSEEEIEYILDFIVPQKGIPLDSAMSIVENNKNSLKKQLETQLVYPSILQTLKENIKKLYFKSLINPGESVGVLTAQSIGEKQTQMTLNTFHKAGLADKFVVSGVSKFSELINATRNPKETSCIVYFKNGNKSIQDLRNTIGSTLIEYTVRDLSLSINVCIDKDPEDWYEPFKILYNNKFEQYTDCVSLQLNLKILYEIKLSIQDLASIIEEKYNDMKCVFSPCGKIDIFIDTSSISLPNGRELFIDNDNVNYIYLEEVVIPNLENTRVCGIPGIKNMFYTKDDTNDTWYIETDGSNFNKLLAHPKVDMTRTVSSNIWDIYNTLGIQAARESLLIEFSNIMEGINMCHVKLLVERMTFSGTITSISRYTMRADESGPLGKCSFEESIEGFTKAGVFGEEEPTRGVSSCIIVGKRSNIGTGCMDLRIDIAKLPKTKKILTEVSETIDFS